MEELEIEFKNMLDYPDFIKLKESFFKDADIITQTNFYIDTMAYHLVKEKIALRIRDTGSHIMMTLKIPQEIGIMEYHGHVQPDILDQEYIKSDDIPENIKHELTARQIPIEKLRIIGALSTERQEQSYQDGLLVLDASYYLDTSDYELEFEVNDYDEGEKQFKDFLESSQIKYQPAKSKIQRFFKRNQDLSSKIL